jgi:N-methylhydantoinase A
MSTRVSVDVGGTYTDLVAYSEETGEITAVKVRTTPRRPEIGVLAAVREGLDPAHLRDARYFMHGTTVGLNAILERRGAVVGLLATAGFRDVLEIRRGDREEMYNIFWRQPEALVPRRLRLPVTERIRADGVVDTVLRPEDVVSAAAAFEDAGVNSVAIAFINAYANPEHELRAAELLRDAGYRGEISLSHRVSGEYREYERTSTTVIDAFVKGRMASYLERLEKGLTELGFAGTLLCSRSGGGAITFAEAAKRPSETLLSGPVGAALGAGELATEDAYGDVISADVGGTSFDTCVVINGRPQVLYQGTVGGMPLLSAWVDVRSIGAGGGSIAAASHGVLTVGPRSAGAVPGPAAYGSGGTEPTVTDAAAVLGMLGRGNLASGIRLDTGLARRSLETLTEALEMTAERLAEGILTVCAASMGDAIREITIERGLDPRDMSLLAIGGAGPLLGCLVSAELDIGRVIVPPFAGNFSAWGLLGTEPTQQAAQTRIIRVDEAATAATLGVLDELYKRLDRSSILVGEGLPSVEEVVLDMRYVGQEHTLSLSVGSRQELREQSAQAVIGRFERAYLATFGVRLEEPVEIVNIRATTRQPLEKKKAKKLEGARGEPRVADSVRAYSFTGRDWHPFAVYAREGLRAGHRIEGPAIVTENTATTYVDRGWSLMAVPSGSLVITKGTTGEH